LKALEKEENNYSLGEYIKFTEEVWNKILHFPDLTNIKDLDTLTKISRLCKYLDAEANNLESKVQIQLANKNVFKEIVNKMEDGNKIYTKIEN